MKVAILGGGGCFALNFAKYLQFVGVDCFGIGRSGPKEEPFWQAPIDYRYYRSRVGSIETLQTLDTERPDVIVNYAAQGEGAASFDANAPDFFQTNCVDLVRLVCDLRQRPYLKHFIQIGSSEVYGSPDGAAWEYDPLWPSSPYSISKAAFDQYLQSMWTTAQFPMNIIRPSNCYVEGQQLHRIIPKTMLCALKGEKVPLHGGGKAEKSYMHADDLSSAVMIVIEKGVLGAVYNVGPPDPISIRGLVGKIAIVTRVPFDDLVEETPDRTGQDARYWIDANAIRSLGWEQRIDLYKGLFSMWDWVKKYPSLKTMSTAYRHLR